VAQEAPKAMPGVTATAQVALPDITGTWMLMSRELPDGTTQMPPAVSGMLTYTAKYRNFNVMWKDAAGKVFSISYVAGYTLTPTAYVETPIMRVMTNEAGPEKVTYAWPPETGTPNPVTIQDGAITFPIAGEPPVITFKGDKMTAVAEGQFTDHWQRVSGK
jgi:hypothetical protein